ncbi:MAG: ABC transporter ATP-binding protein [Bacteroidota bacterium]
MKREGIYIENLQTGYQVKNKPKLISHLPDLHLPTGQFLAIIGRNGIGKSTLLRTLAGLQKTLGGSIFIGEKSLHSLSSIQKARQISLVLTDPLSLAFFSVYELVALGRYPHSNWQGQLLAQDHQIIEKSLSRCACLDLKDRDIQSLSDGQRQRVLIARALAQDTSFLMLDEPTLHLDIPSRQGIFRLLRALSQKEDKGVLIVSHETDLARLYCDQIWLMFTPAPQSPSTIQAGILEDLMIDGTYQKAFEDTLSLSLNLENNAPLAKKCDVHLSGGEKWVQELSAQALRKAGYATGPPSQWAVQVRIEEQSRAYTWILVTSQEEKNYSSLEKLIQALNNFSRNAP